MAIGNTAKPTRHIVLDGPVTDMIEESGLNWLARAMRGDVAIPEWLAKVLENGPTVELPLALGSQVTITAEDGRQCGTYMMTRINLEPTIANINTELLSSQSYLDPLGRPDIDVRFAFINS